MQRMPRKLMRAAAIVAVLLMSTELHATVAAPVADDSPRTFLYNPAALLASRAAVRAGDASVGATYQMVLRGARGLMPTSTEWSDSTGPWSVINKTMALPEGVSRNDYLSIGIYNHPCNNLPGGCKPYPGGHLLPPSKCDNATGLPWEPCDGIHNPTAIAAGDAPRANSMMSAVRTLSLATFLCNETATECEAWAQRAAFILRTWYLSDHTAMEPNLYYGQIVPTASPPNKGHGGFIEWTATTATLDHIELLRYSAPSVWTEQDHAALFQWYGDFLDYMGSKEAAGERDMTNNHGSWFDVMWQGVSLTLGNHSIASEAAAEVATRRIDTQILSDGREWIELERTNPSGYCQYNLMALTLNADLARNSGSADLWGHTGPKGQSIRLALDWLMPYATGKLKWPYSQNIDPPSWGSMFEVFRRASVQFKNETYEEAACHVVKGSAAVSEPFNPLELAGPVGDDPSGYTKNLLNILVPPAFEVQC